MVVLRRNQTTRFGVLASLLGDISAYLGLSGRITGSAGAAYEQAFTWEATEPVALGTHFTLTLTDESSAAPATGSIYVPPGLITGTLTIFGKTIDGPLPIYTDTLYITD